MRHLLCSSFLASALLLLAGCESKPEPTSPSTRSSSAAPVKGLVPFELREGDRVAFLGDTFIEREQHYGWIELMLTARFADKKVTFRNLGWSADLPNGESRLGLSLGQAGTEPTGEAWMLLQKQLQETKPTVVVIGYGMASSFEGEKGLPKFKDDYNRLLDTIEKLSPGCRLLLLGPLRHQRMAPPLPDPTAHNSAILAYTAAIHEIAKHRNAPFVPLTLAFDGATTGSAQRTAWSDNGIHLTSRGYEELATFIRSQLGLDSAPAGHLDLRGSVAETARQVILRKNEFYFHRSRPANMAYIFGFRRGEQGRNAVEMPKFDPMIETEEVKIRELCAHLGESQFKPGRHLLPAELRDNPAAARHTPQPKPEFVVADGFEVTLWAENPHLAKPIQMNFDPEGRLWIASSEVYPQVEPGQAAHDKIIVLEDTNGQGVANKATVFADGLLIPTGVIPGDGGVYVAQSTELLFFKDNNGDGKADERRVVLSGFGTEDTHHNLHTLRWGHDGRLYMSQSIYTRTETETPHGVHRLRSGGIMALRTGTLELDTLFRGWVNAWGHQFDAFGQSFITDGAGGAGINWGLPGGMYQTYARARRILPSVSPGSYPKFASIEIIHSTHFPPDWQGDVMSCDFRAHRVVRFKISEEGSAYITKEMPELLRTTDVTFRPIDVKLGPDGALYIADWSNPIIQHGEVDFRDPRRDHEHGRIWRVQAKARPLAPKPVLVRASNQDLFGQLLSSNWFNRAQANRILAERGPAILPDLTAWSHEQSTEPALLQSLWTHQAIDQPSPVLVRRLLAASDGKVRAAAVRVLSEWSHQPSASENMRATDASGSSLLPATTRKPAFGKTETLDLLAKAVTDSHPRVRLEAIRALGRIPEARSAEIALSALEGIGKDTFLEYALWLTINDLSSHWLQALSAGTWKPEGKEKQLEFALKSIEPSQASSVLSRLLSGKTLDSDGNGPWIELIGQAGGASELRRLLDQTVSNGFSEAASIRALSSLTEAARLRNARPDGGIESLSRLFNASNEKVRSAAIRLAGNWKSGSSVPIILGIAGDDSTPAEVRQASIESLRQIGGNEASSGLRSLTEARRPAAVRRAAVVALAALGSSQAVPQMIEILSSTMDENDAVALWRSLLGNRGAGTAIARGIPKGGLPATPTKAGLRVAREGGRKEPDLLLALSRSSTISQQEQTLSPAELQDLAATAMAQGDPSRGETLYRRAEFGCITCHAIGGAGGKVGPDLTSIGASAPADYLIESILFPNAKIKEGYHSIQVETTDDQELSGILVRENGPELVIRNAQNAEVSLPKNKIKSRANGMSLMPSGLIDELSPGDRSDLFRFLAELGKPGRFDATKGGVPRLWRLRLCSHTEEQAGIDSIAAGPFDEKNWILAYSTVDGRLPGTDLQGTLAAGNRYSSAVTLYAATQFQTPKSGPVMLSINGAEKNSVWLNGKPAAAPNGELRADLPAGTHSLVLRLDVRLLPKQIVVRAQDVNFLAN